MYDDSTQGSGSCGRGSQGFGRQGFASFGNYQGSAEGDPGQFQQGGRWGEDEGRHGHGSHRWERDREEARLWRREERERFREHFRYRGPGNQQAALDNMDPAALYNYNGAQNTAYDVNGAGTIPGGVAPDAGLANNYVAQPNDATLAQSVPTGDPTAAAQTQPQVDSTLLKIGQDAQSQLSAAGFSSFVNAVDSVLASGQATDDVGVMQQVLAQLQQAGMSQTDLSALQQIAQTDIGAAQSADATNQPGPGVDPTLAKIGQDAQSGLSPAGFNAFAQQVETDLQGATSAPDAATLMQQVVGELQQNNALSQTDMTALQGIIQQDLTAAQPGDPAAAAANNQVDPTLLKIGQDAQSGMTADGFNAFAQQVQTDLQSGNAPTDTASLMQQVLGELAQKNTLSQADMTALQGVVQTDIAAANTNPNPNPAVNPADNTSLAGDPSTAPENISGTTNSNGQLTVDATVNQIGVDAQKNMTADGFSAFVQQLATDMQAGQTTDDATLMQNVLAHLQQAGTMSQTDLSALQNVMQTDLTAAANPAPANPTVTAPT
jgi:hypothetical protein